MYETRNPSFEDYRNFEFDKETPAIPVISDDENKKPIYEGKKPLAGSYTTAIELNGDTVVKLDRFLKVDPDNEEIKFGIRHSERFLVPAEGTKGEVIEKVLELARGKKAVYERIGKHIGEYLPDLKGFAVVDSPRKELEKLILSDRSETGEFSERLLSQVPESETTLMEVWENIDPKTELAAKSYDRLKDIHENEEFGPQLQGFSQSAYKLLLEEGIMLDICDRSGIRAITPDNKLLNIKSFSATKDFAENNYGENLYFPRNVSFTGSEIKYFDMYSMGYVSNVVDQESFRAILEGMKENDWKKLEEITSNEKTGHNALFVLRYIVLLKRMGADLTMTE